MSGRRLVIRAVLRVLRWLSWSSVAALSIYDITSLTRFEANARVYGWPLPSTEFMLTEIFAVFCCAIATDRAFSLGEKSFDERD